MFETCTGTWDPYGCGLTIASLWRWMDWIVRGDLILLGLMLGYVVVVAIHVSYRLSRPGVSAVDDRGQRQLAADLGVEVAVVRSIVVAAPYLGLTGACFGVFSGFVGVGMEKYTAMRLIVSLVVLALVTTAAGAAVAVAANCVYHYSRRRLDVFGNQGRAQGLHRTGGFHLAQRLPLKSPFATPPAYALVAGPMLIPALGAFMFFSTAYVRPMGLAVDLAPLQCEDGERRIVLHVTHGGELFLNFEKAEWATLPDRLAEMYSQRAERTIYLWADEGALYQTAMNAMDVIESEGIRVRLITPKAMGGCVVPLQAPLRVVHLVAK